MGARTSYCAIFLHFSDFLFPCHPFLLALTICAKYAQWIQYRPWRELILTGLPTLSDSNTLQIIVVVSGLETVLPKLLHFENMETDPEMLNDLLRALHLVLKLGLQAFRCVKSKKQLSYAWLGS